MAWGTVQGNSMTGTTPMMSLGGGSNYNPWNSAWSTIGRAPTPVTMGSPYNMSGSPTYSPRQTQAAQNQARANAGQAANPRYLMEQYMRPGMSQSLGTLSAALPDIAQAQIGGETEAQDIGMQHAFANAQAQQQAEQANSQNSVQYGMMNAQQGGLQEQLWRKNQWDLLRRLLS